MVHSHCPILRLKPIQILIKYGQKPMEICISLSSINTSTQFYTSYFLSACVSASVSSSVNNTIILTRQVVTVSTDWNTFVSNVPEGDHLENSFFYTQWGEPRLRILIPAVVYRLLQRPYSLKVMQRCGIRIHLYKMFWYILHLREGDRSVFLYYIIIVWVQFIFCDTTDRQLSFLLSFSKGLNACVPGVCICHF